MGEYAEYITSVFGYDKVLPMNTGVEAVENWYQAVSEMGLMRLRV